MNGIIGHTGLIGSNICDKIIFDKYFNSQNIHEIDGIIFDNVYCCAPSGTKWKANQNPQEDLDNINLLIRHLETIQCKKFILIGTIDVNFYHPYGTNRKYLEQFIISKFENTSVYRLPGVFGRGLKKNAIFDLIHSHELEKISLYDTYQWYYLNDICVDMEFHINLINDLYTEPLSIGEINDELFHHDKSLFGIKENPVSYGFSPVNKQYLYSKSDVMDKIKEFISTM
jgi:hypothetical protein